MITVSLFPTLWKQSHNSHFHLIRDFFLPKCVLMYYFSSGDGIEKKYYLDFFIFSRLKIRVKSFKILFGKPWTSYLLLVHCLSRRSYYSLQSLNISDQVSSEESYFINVRLSSKLIWSSFSRTPMVRTLCQKHLYFRHFITWVILVSFRIRDWGHNLGLRPPCYVQQILSELFI